MEEKLQEKQSFSQKFNKVVNDFSGEFKKIVWPSRKELQRKTIIVIITSLLFAAVIFCMDVAFDFALQALIKLFS